MVDQVQQAKELSGPANAAPEMAPASHPATSMVQTMLARGHHNPKDFAANLLANPLALTEILALLHATIGNGFVRDVVEAQATTDAPEPKAADVPLGPVRVTARALRVRRSCDTASSSNIIGRLPRGTVVTALAKEGDWVRIEHQGQTAFIHGDYVVSSAAPKPKQEPKQGGEEDDANIASETNEPEVAPPIAAPPVEASGAGSKATPTPTPTPTPATTTNDAPSPTTGDKLELAGAYKGMFSKVYDTGEQKVQVFVSPGGVSANPDIYLHFHGHRADYGIDEELEWDSKSGGYAGGKEKHQPARNRSGIDQAKEAMAAAEGRNKIAMLPQGVLGEGRGKNSRDHEGGHMADLERLGLPGFLSKILGPLAKDLGVAPLAPGNIGIGGHSAGGYTGAHAALSKAGKLADSITDLTFFDASYSAAHLEDAKQWMLAGKGGKNLRIVNSWFQQSEKSKGKKYRDLWFNRFGPQALEQLAKSKGMTVRHLVAGDKFDAATKVMQHSQLINETGAVQCDILVSMTSLPGGLDHDPLRDRFIDDAMLSIGDGAQGNEQFGHFDRGRLDPQATKPATGKTADDELEDDHDGPDAGTGVAKAEEPADPKLQTLPEPQHVDGNQTTAPEPIKEPEAVKTPPPKAAKSKAKDDDAALREKLYGEEGSIRAERLGRHSTVKVKGKKIDINLTDEQYDFKQRVYNAAVDRIGKGKLYGGVAADELTSFEGKQLRKEVVGPLTQMLTTMRVAGHSVRVSSAYRDPDEDFQIWNTAFDRIYLWEYKKEREKRWPDDPFGPEAVKYTVDKIKSRKAAPGSSNHSNGVAVDLTIKVNGKDVPNQFGDQKAWKSSPHYQWLKDHAREFGFKNYSAEAWHYDYRP